MILLSNFGAMNSDIQRSSAN